MQKTIEQFLLALYSIKRQPRQMVDSGLLIIDEQTSITTNHIIEIVCRTLHVDSCISITYNTYSRDLDIIRNILDGFDKKQVITIEIEEQLSDTVKGILLQLEKENMFTWFDNKSKRRVKYVMPKETRIICIIKEKNLVRITNNTFYSLFGLITTI